jgi:hypothetical protein
VQGTEVASVIASILNYIAPPNEEMVREHAKQGGFPANRVSEIKRIIDPTSAEARA